MPRLLSSVIFACRHPRRPHPLEKRESPEKPSVDSCSKVTGLD